MSDPLHFMSFDGRFELCLPGELIEQVFARCSSAALCETGGILVGKYSHDQRVAQVTAISDSPSDSTASHSLFVRGIAGLCRWLRHLWRGNSSYYLGEWHFHPAINSQPSAMDRGTMIGIATAEAYKCPEPVLLIVGHGNTSGWLLHAQVTTRDGSIVVLRQRVQKSDSHRSAGGPAE
jgi:integrative and conjugative element protein (TIGR02256 family)